MRKLLAVAALLVLAGAAALLLLRTPRAGTVAAPEERVPNENILANDSGLIDAVSPSAVDARGAGPERQAVPAPSESSDGSIAATLAGRVVLDGRPVLGAGAWLVLKPAATPAGEGSAGTPPPLRSVSGPDGRFLFEVFAPGSYELQLVSAQGDLRTLAPLAIERSQPYDLGDIAFPSRASIRGIVLLPRSLAGACPIVFATGSDQHRLRTEADPQGRFAFESVLPGDYELEVTDASWQLGLAPRSLAMELAPGEHRDVVLDLRDEIGAVLTVRATCDGEPARGSQCFFELAGHDLRLWLDLDAGGAGVVVLPPSSEGTLLLRNREGTLLQVAPLGALTAGEPIERVLAVETGQLVLAVPPGVLDDQPERAWLFVHRSSDGREVLSWQHAFGQVDFPLGAQDVALGALAVGSYEIGARFELRSEPPARAPVELTATAVVRRGETTRAVLVRR